jgi:hypothetical protein
MSDCVINKVLSHMQHCLNIGEFRNNGVLAPKCRKSTLNYRFLHVQPQRQEELRLPIEQGINALDEHNSIQNAADLLVDISVIYSVGGPPHLKHYSAHISSLSRKCKNDSIVISGNMVQPTGFLALFHDGLRSSYSLRAGLPLVGPFT